MPNLAMENATTCSKIYREAMINICGIPQAW